MLLHMLEKPVGRGELLSAVFAVVIGKDARNEKVGVACFMDFLVQGSIAQKVATEGGNVVSVEGEVLRRAIGVPTTLNITWVFLDR